MDLSDEDFDRFIYWKLKEQRNREESDQLLLSCLCISDQHLLLILLPQRKGLAQPTTKKSIQILVSAKI